jgi:hypothetical protein
MSDGQQEINLMKSIHEKFGASISDTCRLPSVPESFLAALVANETGGEPRATRFEIGVLHSLWEVLQNRKANYGSIGREALLFYFVPSSIQLPRDVSALTNFLADALRAIDALATSWGLTQIMGYEILDQHLTGTNGLHPSVMEDPDVSLRYTAVMLAEFAARKNLDPQKDLAELFDCWNTGRPHAPTADPQYIPKGLARMKIYEQLEIEPPAADQAGSGS